MMHRGPRRGSAGTPGGDPVDPTPAWAAVDDDDFAELPVFIPASGLYFGRYASWARPKDTR
jgi:hypothetical protein